MVGINSFPASSCEETCHEAPGESQAISCIGWELYAGAVEKVQASERVKFSVLSVLTYTQCTIRD